MYRWLVVCGVMLGSIVAVVGADSVEALSSDREDVPGRSGGVISPTTDEPLVWALPYSALNVAPGFGIGSYAQEEQAGARRLLLIDGVSAAVLAAGVGTNVISNGGSHSDVFNLAELLGAAGLLVGRVYGIVRPIVFTARNGANFDSLVVPISYNIAPGFGLGSRIQDDSEGAATLLLLEAAALGPMVILAGLFANLWMPEPVFAVISYSLLTVYGASKVVGVVRPVRFRNRQAQAASH